MVLCHKNLKKWSFLHFSHCWQKKYKFEFCLRRKITLLKMAKSQINVFLKFHPKIIWVLNFKNLALWNSLTGKPHFQISSYPTNEVSRRSLSWLPCSGFMRMNIQKQHFIQHDLTKFWWELCYQLQTSSKQLFSMGKVLKKEISEQHGSPYLRNQTMYAFRV